MQIWFLISEDDRKKLKAKMPANWVPPHWDERFGDIRQSRAVVVDVKLESPEEIEKLMKRPSKWGKRPIK